MRQLKKAWITPHADDALMLSLASDRPDQDYTRLLCNSTVFPDRDNPGHQSHTVTVGLFSREDLEYLHVFLTKFLYD